MILSLEDSSMEYGTMDIVVSGASLVLTNGVLSSLTGISLFVDVWAFSNVSAFTVKLPCILRRSSGVFVLSI